MNLKYFYNSKITSPEIIEPLNLESGMLYGNGQHLRATFISGTKLKSTENKHLVASLSHGRDT